MSKIGKQTIIIPNGVTVNVENSTVIIRGPKGELKRTFPPQIGVKIDGSSISVDPGPRLKKADRALWGTVRALIANMIRGVSQGFEKKLEFEGIGFRAEAGPKELTLFVGFSHPVKLAIPAGISLATAKNSITVMGIDLEAVGQFAAKIRNVRKPEPYKGTGIRYAGEVIRKKAGKKVAGTAA